MNIIIPMAGLGSRFSEYGFKQNKYLLPIDKYLTKMIEKAILTLNINIENCYFIFILREETNIDIELREYLQNICVKNNYKCKILSVNKLTEGPASTVYIAKEIINNDIPLIISNSDQILYWNFNNFYKTCIKYDGCVLTYRPNYELTIGNIDKHSFVKTDQNNVPIQFIEKTVISKEALVGVHYYKKGQYFIEAYEYLFKNNIRAPNNEFYLSYTYQAMLEIGSYTIGTHLLNNDEQFYPVGEPNDYFAYYNKCSPIIKYELNDYKIVNNFINNNNFIIDFQYKNTTQTYNDELIIIIKGSITGITDNIFLTGKINPLFFKEDTFILRIFDINSKDDFFNYINICDYVRGWIIGDFEPNIKKIKDYEIGLLTHKKDEKWGFHYHQLATEINILLDGRFIINNQEIKKGDVFIFEKNMIACPIFIEECKIICIKIPSCPNDKYII